MAKRPVVLKFVFGKGLVKRRKESEDTARFIAEQATISYANSDAIQGLTLLKQTIARDVRRELSYLADMFLKYVIGAPRTQTKLRGRLTAQAKSSGGTPFQNLGGLNLKWPARSSRYLNQKVLAGSTKKWFAFSGDLGSAFAGAGVGETLFEEIFGPVSVEIRRNKKGWGDAGGDISSGVLTQSGPTTKGTRGLGSEQLQDAVRGKYGTPGGNSTDVRMMLGTVNVRALGKLNPGNITRSSLYGPGGPVASWNPDAAIKLAGREKTYRPSLEPFLDFFFEKSMGHAISERLRRGTTASSLSRGKRS